MSAPPAFNLERLFTTVFEPQRGEKVTLLVDLPHGEILDTRSWSERRQMALEWQRSLAQTGRKLGVSVNPIVYYLATGQHNGPLPEVARSEGNRVSLTELLSDSNIVLALTEYSATAPLMIWGRKLKTLRGASMPGVSKSMEATALSADYKQVARRSEMLVKRLEKAEMAKISFTTGHELRVDLRYRQPHADGGRCPPGADPPFINLPSGEAYQAPYEGERPDEPSRTEGTIPVARGGELVLLKIENNRIVKVLGEGPHALHLHELLEVDAARRNIAEIGLGCNDKAVVSSNVLEDEKAGFHWAFGRSEHLGGIVGPEDFADPSHVMHYDIVYAPGSPIGVARLSLEFPNGSSEEIMHDSRYTIF